jgi:hypothetical protein
MPTLCRASNSHGAPLRPGYDWPMSFAAIAAAPKQSTASPIAMSRAVRSSWRTRVRMHKQPVACGRSSQIPVRLWFAASHNVRSSPPSGIKTQAPPVRFEECPCRRMRPPSEVIATPVVEVRPS